MTLSLHLWMISWSGPARRPGAPFPRSQRSSSESPAYPAARVDSLDSWSLFSRDVLENRHDIYDGVEDG